MKVQIACLPGGRKPSPGTRAAASRPAGGARRGFRLLAGLALAALFWAAGCNLWPDPVRIGFSGPLTGRWSDLGVQGRNGATLAVEELNAAGGIAGRPVELLAADEQDSPQTAREAARHLDRQGAAVLVGFMTSAAALAGLPVAEAAGLAVVSPSTTTTALSGRDDAFFRVIPDVRAYARRQAELISRRKGAASFLVVLDQGNAAFTEPFAQTFAESITGRGGRVAGTVRIPPGQGPDGRALARQAAAAGAGAILALVSARDLARLVLELRPAAPGLAVYSAMWGFNSEFLEMAGAGAEGVASCMIYPLGDASPALAGFFARFRQRFGREPSAGALLSYEAVQAAALALGRTRGQRKGVAEALAGLGRFRGVSGDIVFDRFGDVDRPMFWAEVQAGRIRTSGTGDD